MSHFAVGDIEGRPGERNFGFINVAPMAGGGWLRVPVHVAEGMRDGPTLGIICTQHGEEVMPLASIRQVLLTMDLRQLRGRLVIVPVANPVAFLLGQRSSWVDALYGGTTGNLNRLWPGKVNGFFTERLAWAISESVLGRADIIMDLHSGTPDELLIYYAYYPVGSSKAERSSRLLAETFGMEVLMRRPESSQHRGSPGRTLTEFVLDDLGKPVVTVELGEFYGLRPNGEAEAPELPTRPLPDVGVQGILNVMYSLEMLPGSPVLPDMQVVVSPETRCLPDAGGLLYPEVTVRDIGRVLPKGARLGRIMDAQSFDLLGEIRAPYERNLLVSARVGKPVSKINPGDQCFHVADFGTAQWIRRMD